MNKLLLTGILTAGTASPNPECPNNRTKPTKGRTTSNDLFILSDDHTSQAWGIYGGVLADYAYNNNVRQARQRRCSPR